MNRALISSCLVAAFMLVACNKPPAGDAATTSPSPSGQSGTSSMGAPPSAASAASN